MKKLSHLALISFSVAAGALAGTALLAACTSTHSAIHMEAGKTSFVGETEGYIGTDGEFVLTSSAGVVCEGEYEFTKVLMGKGEIECSDGREGDFVFTSEQDKDAEQITLIKGNGKFKDGSRFVITFGEARSKYAAPAGNYYEVPPMYTGKPVPYKGQVDINL